ncbi:DUF732 domain-containing protein [Streptomyces avidinii]
MRAGHGPPCPDAHTSHRNAAGRPRGPRRRRLQQQPEDRREAHRIRHRAHVARRSRRRGHRRRPAGPTGDKRVIYLATLNGIDPEIVNGKDDEAISRGRDQCTAMKDEKDPTKRVAQVEQRFTGPGHPNGFGPTKSALILATVQANICPTY